MAREAGSAILSVVEEVTTLNTSFTHLYDTYDYYIHPHWRQYPPVSDNWHYFIGFFITVVGLSGVIGNIVVIWTFTSTKTLKTPSNMLIVNLALSDLTFSAVNGFPLLTISAFNKRWVFGDAACEFYGLIGGIFGLMSINTLAMISIDRYICITKPLQAARLMTRKKAFFMIVIVWSWAIAWSLLPLFGLGAYIPEGFQTSCTFDYLTKTMSNRIYIVGMYVFAFALPLVIIIGCYVGILKAIRKHAKEMASMADKMNAEEAEKKEKSKTEIKIAKIAMMLVSLFILSWSPYATIALLAQFGDPSFVTPFMSELPVMLAKASAMHNPIVYALSHPKFREALMKKAPCFLSCCMPSEKPKDGDKAPVPPKPVMHRQLTQTFSDASMSSVQTNLSEGFDMKTPKEQWASSAEMVRQLVGVIVCMATKKSTDQPIVLPQNGAAQIGEAGPSAETNEEGVFTVNDGNLDLVAAAGALINAFGPESEPEKPLEEEEVTMSGTDNPALESEAEEKDTQV
ncbi:rhodopsin, GQ-coupled-like [Ylistrum balloti]|uniref:rhodopsin, GQ-coupled-like n=1 Tax=Ylistrum balloti TaxID=509963 RepID=UPI002905D6C0|nr:rhodopsin, GQ-coupled-like [Ylistrum balloti]